MRSTKNSLQAELIPTDPVIKDISFELTSTFADLNHSWIDDTLADLNDYTEVKEF